MKPSQQRPRLGNTGVVVEPPDVIRVDVSKHPPHHGAFAQIGFADNQPIDLACFMPRLKES
jgi:hypothetical protein